MSTSLWEVGVHQIARGKKGTHGVNLKTVLGEEESAAFFFNLKGQTNFYSRGLQHPNAISIIHSPKINISAPI